MRHRSGACHAEWVTVRCLIVDDNESYLEAAAALLERQGMTVVGTATTADDAIRQARRSAPDVLLVDIILGRTSGFDLARRLAEEGPPAPSVILISTHDEADFADLIGEAPAVGFLPKSELSAQAIERLVDAP